MSDLEKTNKEILGYGEVLEVLAGVKEDGESNIISYHFTPVSLKDIPSLTKLLDKFFKNAEKSEWNEEAIRSSAELIQMSIKKMHPSVTVEMIEEQFTLAGIAKAVNLVMDVNDFLSAMETMKSQANLVVQMSQVESSKNQVKK